MPDRSDAGQWRVLAQTATLKLMRHLLLLACLTVPATAAVERPNVVIFFVDDLGWTDVGCYGSDFYETPHVDQLAADGIRFTNAYAACTVCSPSRAAMLTGQYPARLHVTDFIPGHAVENTPLTMPDWTQRLKLEETTIAELLQNAGYRTAHLGKWHLTPRDRNSNPNDDGNYPEFYPEHQGFEFNIGGCERGAPSSYFWPYGRGSTLAERKRNNTFRMLPGRPTPKYDEQTYLTDQLADEAVRLIGEFGQDPFLIYFPFYNVHTPLQGRPDLVAKYETKLKQHPNVRHRNAIYAAMVESFDHAIGRVMKQLEEQDVSNRTLVIFSSDNGGLAPKATSNSPLRQGKGSIYEGGVRVPTIIRWPGMVEAGSTCEEPVITVDFFPTILEATGIKTPQDLASRVDGKSLVPLMSSPDRRLERDAIFWHYPHYHMMGAIPHSAIRVRDWKLIERHNGAPLELYHLPTDIHEDHNLAETEPDRTTQLRDRLHKWRAAVGAQMPVANPNYDASRPTGRPGARRFVPISPVRR